MAVLALLRHGQSQWNLDNRFTGWVDVPLTAQGEAEGRRAGELLAQSGVAFDKMHTSLISRAIRTGNLALQSAGLDWIPVVKDWRLNERHYGALTGLDKAETAARHGAEQVKIWRRAYDIPPPPMEPGGEFDFAKDPRYAQVLDQLPATESLKTTLERVLPYWDEAIAPDLKAGKNVIIAAHGNSLRALVKHLFGVSDADIINVEMPTGNPLLIELNAQLKPVGARYLDAARAVAIPPLPK
jgi:2,3-bisphosphoglycerate-dependent phosphoglycerate mutase